MRRILLPVLFLVILPFGTIVFSNENIPSSSVKKRPISQTLSVSRKIDALVSKHLAAKNLEPNPIISDDVFVRRAYLNIIGRIPSHQETVEFLEERSSGKRQLLIDQLLDSDGFASHQFNYFADLLRLKSRLRQIPGEPYIDFVKSSIRENKPYDVFVRELLTASGSYAERGHGAVGYYMRDYGMPEDNMSNTIRIFLGTRLECAQCHDHPFDVWTQRDYFEMVAFTGGVLMRVDTPLGTYGKIRQMTREGTVDEKTRRNLQNMLRPLTYGIKGTGTGLAQLPDDYQESDGEAEEIVTAKTMFEKKSLVVPEIPQLNTKGRRKGNAGRGRGGIRNAKQVNSREAYADWMTDRENPRFTTVIANRMWKRAMGVGLIEPVDIITEETAASNAELMTYLTDQMAEMDFDLKQFLRAIYNSQTFQRVAVVSDAEEITEFSFRGPLLRRMSAEQLWDSLVTLTVAEVDTRQGPDMARRYYGMDLFEIYEKTKTMSPDEIVKLAEQDPRKAQANQKKKASNQQNSIRAEFNNRLRELQKKQQLAKKKKDYPRLKELKKEQMEMSKAMGRKYNSRSRDMIRASEISSPARPGHLLREFGQSDREQIENSNSEAAVTQVLSLMNGFIEKRIASNPYTELMSNVEQAKDIPAKVDVIFLSILNRMPTETERKQWLDDVSVHGKEVAADLIWTLVNNSEFLFVQ